MKKHILLLIASVQICGAQYYTNHNVALFSTNSIVGSFTNTYAGTNLLDFTRYRTGLLTVQGQSSGTNTNFIGLSFVPSGDATNWDYSGALTYELQFSGTNLITKTFPVEWTSYGYIKPYQTWNTNADAFTNVSVGLWTKSVPRN